MKLNLACKRFQKLWNERDVRDLSPDEDRFVSQHRRDCEECACFESSSDGAMSMLRMATMEPEVSIGFEDRVIRKVKVQTVRESLGYWTPAMIGAGIACVAIVATLQIAASPVKLNPATLPAGEAKLDVDHERPIPNLTLTEKPHLDQ